MGGVCDQAEGVGEQADHDLACGEGGGKGGGPKVVTEGYRYYASFAVALCEGPIGGVCRIWADGKPFDVPGAVWRVYTGTETQLPDPFITAKMGAANAPAYRGIAYVVFEELAKGRPMAKILRG